MMSGLAGSGVGSHGKAQLVAHPGEHICLSRIGAGRPLPGQFSGLFQRTPPPAVCTTRPLLPVHIHLRAPASLSRMRAGVPEADRRQNRIPVAVGCRRRRGQCQDKPVAYNALWRNDRAPPCATWRDPSRSGSWSCLVTPLPRSLSRRDWPLEAACAKRSIAASVSSV